MPEKRNGQQKHVVVIGGGLAGLAAAYDLVRAGFRVTVLEAAADFGGLASSLQIEGIPIERFYHFICRADTDLIDFVRGLGLARKLKWRQTRTSFYHDGRVYAFGTPIDLLRFSAVPWRQRFRFGFHILYSRYRRQWKWLDQIPARPWLIENIGEQAYNVIWHPLLRIKFGDYYDKISAAWVWHRIWRVATSRTRLWERERFGYLEHGSATIIDKLVTQLQQHPLASLRANTLVREITVDANRVSGIDLDGSRTPADAVVSTVALPLLWRMLPDLKGLYFERAQTIRYIGIVLMLLSLKQPFSSNFWMNIHDARISFNGVIEQSNLNRNLDRAGLNILYIPFYLPVEEPRYRYSDEQLYQEYIPMLKLLNPAFRESWIKEWHVFRTAYAQAICSTNFAELIPDPRTPIQGLYLTDSTQFYPEDRTISAAIRQGRKAAQFVMEDLG